MNSTAPAPSSPHPTPEEWLDKAIRRLNEPGGFVYGNDLTLIADLSHALSVTLQQRNDLLKALKFAVAWLEPGPCGQHNCEGCLCEMQLAHDALQAAIAQVEGQ